MKMIKMKNIFSMQKIDNQFSSKLLIILSIFLVAVLLVGCKKAEFVKSATQLNTTTTPTIGTAGEATSIDNDIASLDSELDVDSVDADLGSLDKDLDTL